MSARLLNSSADISHLLLSCCYRCQRRLFAASSFSKVNYYDILEVTPSSSQAQIKAAYYRLSKKYHPDVATTNTSEAKERFARLSAAYEVLGNPRNRRTYDVEVLGRGGSIASDNNASNIDIEYREFVRRRGTFGNRATGGAPPTGKTPIFDFDEFYRQHYGESVRQSHVDKQYEAESKERERQRQMKSRNHSFIVIAMFTLGMLTMLKVSL